MQRTIRARSADEQGQTMAEYALILGLLIVGVVAAMAALSGAIETGIGQVVDLFP